MRKIPSFIVSGAIWLCVGDACRAETVLTVYDQGLAVVTELATLDLKQGRNQVCFPGVTSRLRPESVVLRSLTEGASLRVVEQSFSEGARSQDSLLAQFEGQVIDFLVENGSGRQVIKGKIVSSGRKIREEKPSTRVSGYRPPQAAVSADLPEQPIIEVDGKLRFGLPGTPLFPADEARSPVGPSLNWVIESDTAGKVQAEVTYLTDAIDWDADYSFLLAKNDALELTGWATLTNTSGRSFENATVRLMAGPDVPSGSRAAVSYSRGVPLPKSPAFSQYQPFFLGSKVTLRDGEKKQLEMVRAAGVSSLQLHVYDGMGEDDPRYRARDPRNLRHDRNYGTASRPEVSVIREIPNTEENGLGASLPAGSLRIFGRDADGRLGILGEDTIKRIGPKEIIRVAAGTAGSMSGERKRTDYKMDSGRRGVSEAFEIRVRNDGEEAADIRIVEHLRRSPNWKISEASSPFMKRDANTVEFRATVGPGEESALTYRVQYSW